MKRLLSLDVLRGIAVLLVVIRHSNAFADTLLAPIHKGGWVAVDLFFVLSGFLVSGLLFKEFDKKGTIEPINFLIRRGWKIYPAFWVLIAVTVFFFWSTGAMDSGKTLTELVFMQSYFSNRYWGHTWSLAVEEHFYIILPFVLLYLSRTNFKTLPAVVLSLMVGCLTLRILNPGPFTEQTHMWPTHLRLDGMFFGVLLSYWFHTRPDFKAFCTRHSRVLTALGCVMLVPPFVLDQENVFMHTFGLTLNTLGSGAILCGVVSGGVTENALTKSVGWVGFYSYSIYLWHNAVIGFFAPMLGVENPMLFSLVGSVIAGVGMANLVEMPLLKLRDSLSGKHHALPSPAQPSLQSCG